METQLFAKDNDEHQLPPLLDSFMEEVGEIKLEIHKVRNRANIIRGFYQHVRNTQNITIRRELEDKVNAEVELISASLMKVTDALLRWRGLVEMSSGVQKMQRSDMMKGVRAYLKEVLTDYEDILTQHRDTNCKELQELLKVAGRDKKNAYTVEQGDINMVAEQKHIEIEARYSELLRTDNNLRYLKTKYGQHLPSGDHTDLALLHLAKSIDGNARATFRHNKLNRSLVFLFASLSSLSLILVIILMAM